MPTPLSGAYSSRPETNQERNYRIALEDALAAIEALRTGETHPGLYQGAEGHQRKLAERSAKRLSIVAEQTAFYPKPYAEKAKPKEINWYDDGHSNNWRGD